MSSHNHANHVAKGAVKAGAAVTKAGLGTRLLHSAAKHPVLVFGIGVLAGVYIYKNRQQILAEDMQSDENDCCS